MEIKEVEGSLILTLPSAHEGIEFTIESKQKLTIYQNPTLTFIKEEEPCG